MDSSRKLPQQVSLVSAKPMHTTRRKGVEENTGPEETVVLAPCSLCMNRISPKALLSLNKEIWGFFCRILSVFIQESTYRDCYVLRMLS